MSSTDEPAAKRKRTELDDESAAESDSKEQSSTATATAAEAATTVASGTTAESMKIDLDEWDGHLYPLIKLLKNKKGGEFEDSYGNTFSLTNHSPECLELLDAEQDGAIEAQETDRGSLYFTLKKHDPTGQWVFSATEIDLNGYCGAFTRSVIVKPGEEMDRLKKYLRKVLGYRDEE